MADPSQMMPAGPQPSLVTTSLLVVSIIFPVVATGAVVLRFHARTVKKHKPSADDWVCALAQLAAWAHSINTFVAGGLGGIDYTKPGVNLLSGAVIFLRALWIEGFPLVISLSLIKISILLFYARIFTTPRFKLSVKIFNGILVAWCIAMCVCQLLAANPVQAAWNPLAVNALRYDYNAFTLAFAGMSIVFDVVVLCFPIPVIRKLRMPLARKLQVAAIFWLGIFCCVASAIRFYFLYSEISNTTASTGPDRYLNPATAFTWATIEPNTSIIAACLPCYGPFFAAGTGLHTLLNNFKSLFSSRDISTGQNGDSSKGRRSSNSFPLKAAAGRNWQKLDASKGSHHIDIERGNSFADQQPHSGSGLQVHVTRDFTRTDERM